jgi:hypothetical protein
MFKLILNNKKLPVLLTVIIFLPFLKLNRFFNRENEDMILEKK